MSVSSKIEALTEDLNELNKLSLLATRSKVKDILFIETRKIETELISLKGLNAESSEESTPKGASVVLSNTKKCYESKITNYAWDQSDKFMKIYIDLSGIQDLPGENISCDFSSRSFSLIVKELNNRNYTLSIKNLLYPILPDSSYFKVKKDRIVIFMQKNREKHWTSLIEKETKKVPDMDPNTDPSEGLMSIMKQLYEEGDDETKRQIAKAMVESQKNKM